MTPRPRARTPLPASQVVDVDDYEHTLGRHCCVPGCGVLIHDLSPVEVCRPCGMKIARVFSEDVRHEGRAPVIARHRRREAVPSGPSYVYYIQQVGDYVKIGFTSRLVARMATMHVVPSCLLAVEPGGREKERERHEEFAEERRLPRREDFYLSPRLVELIEKLRAEHEIPLEARPATIVHSVTPWRVT